MDISLTDDDMGTEERRDCHPNFEVLYLPQIHLAVPVSEDYRPILYRFHVITVVAFQHFQVFLDVKSFIGPKLAGYIAWSLEPPQCLESSESTPIGVHDFRLRHYFFRSKY
jgi:hypothetical protein